MKKILTLFDYKYKSKGSGETSIFISSCDNYKIYLCFILL